MEFYWSQIPVSLIGLLHVLFMLGELLPWGSPAIMHTVLKKWPEEPKPTQNPPRVLPMVVHNAGIYNGIVAAALFAAAIVGPSAFLIHIVLLSGGIVAGVFGALTMRPKKIYIQALLGALALVAVLILQGR